MTPHFFHLRLEPLGIGRVVISEKEERAIVVTGNDSFGLHLLYNLKRRLFIHCVECSFSTNRQHQPWPEFMEFMASSPSQKHHALNFYTYAE